MNIEQAIRIAKEQHGTLIGFHSIPVPVYQVLLDYDTIDDNPFFPIQKAILQYIDQMADIEKEKGAEWSLNYLAALLGLDVPLVREVYNDIKEKGLVLRIPETELLTVSTYAHEAYLANGSRPHKRLTGSILVDGKSFELFTDEIYESILNDNGVQTSVFTKNITSHLPIDLSQINSSPEASNLVSALNSHKRDLKSIGLGHAEGNNFKIIGLEKKFLRGVCLVYIQVKDGLLKIPYVGQTPLKTFAASNTSNCRFSLKADKEERKIFVTANLGYSSNDDSKNKSVEGSDTRWNSLICSIYGVSEEYAGHTVMTDPSGNKCIFADEDLLIHSSNPSKLLDDVLMPIPHTRITLGKGKFDESGVLLVRIEYDDNLKPYMEIRKAIDTNENLQQLKEQLAHIAPEDWRKRLVIIGQYSILEEIDCLQYIHPLK